MPELPDLSSLSSYGAVLDSEGVCHWCVWAPRATTVQLVLFDEHGQRSVQPMRPDASGNFRLDLPGIENGQRYAYSLDGGPDRPDFASAWQPDGVHAPSAVWDTSQYPWTDQEWCGIARADLILYELHVGTFSPAGTFAGILSRLAELKELGITAIELMPVGQFPGVRNWGYDGAYWSAVQNSYGGPRELQRLVNACHAAGLGVILDVVYNHLGPEGNYLGEFGPYATDLHHTPWGPGMNYDDTGCGPMRTLVLQNVRRWIRDFHLDGLRLDAVHAICDRSPVHLLTEIKFTADAAASERGWPAHVIAESCLNDPRLLWPVEDGGYGLDAQWSDDFHHCVHALLTGERDGYYLDYDDPAVQLTKAFNETFVYNGIHSLFLGRMHGAPVGDLSGDRFVVSIQTHDQVGNRACGDRLAHLLTPPQLRLAAALLLLSPHVPLLFMGEEWGEQRPFPFFCDFGDPALQEAVRQGRRAEFSGFAWLDAVPDPQDEATFQSAVLSETRSRQGWSEGLWRLYRDLLHARRQWPALRDYRRRQAMLEPGPFPGLLLLKRGDPSRPEEQMELWFNLSAEPAMCPTAFSDRRILLRTEAPCYRGDDSADRTERFGAAPPEELAPFEALVLKPEKS